MPRENVNLLELRGELNSPQRHRWTALSLLEAESRMRRLSGYEDLPKLKRALKDANPDRE